MEVRLVTDKKKFFDYEMVMIDDWKEEHSISLSCVDFTSGVWIDGDSFSPPIIHIRFCHTARIPTSEDPFLLVDLYAITQALNYESLLGVTRQFLVLV